MSRSSKIMDTAQRYMDFGFGREFRWRASNGPCWRSCRYHRSKWAAYCAEDMVGIRAKRFTFPVDSMHPVLPRWSA